MNGRNLKRYIDAAVRREVRRCVRDSIQNDLIHVCNKAAKQAIQMENLSNHSYSTINGVKGIIQELGDAKDAIRHEHFGNAARSIRKAFEFLRNDVNGNDVGISKRKVANSLNFILKNLLHNIP